MIKFSKILPIVSTTLAIIALVGVGYIYAQPAFGPTANPPAGNTPAPVNVGAMAQLKDGGLAAGSLGATNLMPFYVPVTGTNNNKVCFDANGVLGVCSNVTGPGSGISIQDTARDRSVSGVIYREVGDITNVNLSWSATKRTKGISSIIITGGKGIVTNITPDTNIDEDTDAYNNQQSGLLAEKTTQSSTTQIPYENFISYNSPVDSSFGNNTPPNTIFSINVQDNIGNPAGASASLKWAHMIYYGSNIDPSIDSESEIKSQLSKLLDITKFPNGSSKTFAVENNKYIYYAYPKGWGTISTYSFVGDTFTNNTPAPLTISMTNSSGLAGPVTTDYYVYRLNPPLTNATVVFK